MPRRKKSPEGGPPLLRWLRRLATVAVSAAVALVVAVVAASLLLDFDAYKPDIAAAIQTATGRDVEIAGPVEVSPGFSTTITLHDVALAAPPGGSALHVQKLDIRLATIPLLFGSVAIERLVLVKPALELAGVFGDELPLFAAAQGSSPRPAATPANEAPAEEADAAAAALPLEFGAVKIEGGSVGWTNPRTGRVARVDIPVLELRAESLGSSMLITGRLHSGGRTLTVGGDVGPIGRLLNPNATLPWQVAVKLNSDGVRLAARGSVTQARRDPAFQFLLDAAVNDLAAIEEFLPDPRMQLREGSATLNIRKVKGSAAELSGLTLHLSGLLAPADLPGIKVDHADFSAPALDQPVTADVAVVYHDIPVHASGMVAKLSAALPGAQPAAPVRLEFSVEALGALLSVKGSARAPAKLSGLDVSIIARAASLGALSPLAGRTLPDFKQVGLEGVLDGEIAPGRAISLRRLAVSTPEGNFGGDVTLLQTTRPALRGTLKVGQLDLDAVLAILSASPSLASAGPAAIKAAPPVPGTATPPPAAVAAPDTPSSPDMLFSSVPIDLHWLDQADADFKFTAAALLAKGLSYANIAGRMVLKDGRLMLDPLSGDAPGGRVDAKFSIESRAAEPPVALSLRAPSVTLQAIAAPFGDYESVTGNVFIDAALTAAGRTPHNLAASLNGRLSLTIQDGDLSNVLVGSLLSPLLKAAQAPPNMLGGMGRTRLRCLAARFEVRQGEASVTTLVADTGRLSVDGTGSINLGSELLDLRLKPLLRTGPGIVVPVRVDGRLLEPKYAVEMPPGGKAGGALSATVTALLPGARPAEKPADPCPPALAAVRGTPVPAPAQPQATPAPLLPKFGDVPKNAQH